MPLTFQCHCGSSSKYKNCCGPFIDQQQLPETAEQLMRSRYSAFKLKRFDYLITTHLFIDDMRILTTKDFDANIDWLGLKIISTDESANVKCQSTVEFAAFYHNQTMENSNQYAQLHEKSYFEKKDNCWMYVRGEPLKDIKLSRNELCFCNSGKKYKKCHAV